jgi:hypothetical protein
MEGQYEWLQFDSEEEAAMRLDGKVAVITGAASGMGVPQLNRLQKKELTHLGQL